MNYVSSLKVFLFVGVVTLSSISAQAGKLGESREYKSGAGISLRYWIMKPQGYDTQSVYPLVLCLHGAGGRGKENMNRSTQAFKVLSVPEVQEKYPSFILSPQLPVDNTWNSVVEGTQLTYIDMVEKIIKQLCREFRIDSKRIYVTGQSRGGFGTWEAITAKTKLFAAAVPVCGGGDATKVKTITHIPVWAFHGAEDRVVPPFASQNMVDALKKAGGNVRYNEYENVGHKSWETAWEEKELISWLFSQRK